MPRSLPVVANSTNHLVVLIDKAVQQHGPNCNLNYIDVSNVDDFKGVFRKWPKFNGDISKWVIHGKNADAMFETVPQEPVVATDPSHLQTLIRQTLHLNGDASDLNHIDVSDITYFTDTFKAFPTFNGDISKWSVGNADTMKCMFKGCAFNGDISSWDVSKVLTMEGMFLDSKFDGDLSRWDVSRVRNMQDMFGKSQFNQNISRWNTSDVRSMAGMFSESKFNQPIGDWDVRQVQLFGMMFALSSFNHPLSKWKTSSARNTTMMFVGAAFDDDISGWDVSQVVRLNRMFAKSTFAQDLSAWNLPAVLEDEELEEMAMENNHFLPGQSMSPWIIRLHLLKKMTPSDPVWAQAFTTTAPVAEGLGLPWQEHVQAIMATHANSMGRTPALDVETHASMDAHLFA